jgi:Protein of unknown function (DUF3443)
VRANLFAALIGMLCVAGCGGGGDSLGGGGGSGGGGGGGGGSTGNVQAIVVDSGPPPVANSNTPAINTAYTTVTICAPGSTTNCQTIDHIQVDTGSSGLRILNEQVAITLPLQKDTAGNVIAECVKFVDGASWGPVRTADVKISGETALNQEVQIIGDTSYGVPTTCQGAAHTSTDPNLEDSVATFGANGILGVAPYVSDCGSACLQQGNGTYYTCATTTTCAQSAMAENLQVSNPVAAFTTDNNGVIIQLPSVATSGVASVSGSIIFGVGTQSNNALGNATAFSVASTGFLTTNYKIGTLTQSFIDTGSNAWYFPDSTIPACTTNVGFYCPSPDQNLQATLTNSISGGSKGVSFTVTSADALFKNAKTVIGATSGLAANSGQFAAGGSVDGTKVFDYGLPFHFGKSVFVVIEGKSTTAGTGPYFAF